MEIKMNLTDNCKRLHGTLSTLRHQSKRERVIDSVLILSKVLWTFFNVDVQKYQKTRFIFIWRKIIIMQNNKNTNYGIGFSTFWMISEGKYTHRPAIAFLTVIHLLMSVLSEFVSSMIVKDTVSGFYV